LQQEILAAKTGTLPGLPVAVYLIAENMTKETITRAIARGGPRELGSELSDLTYEAVLPGGIAFLMYYISQNTDADLNRMSVKH
jgi:transcriptional/translational regulatory protein YebC/TACO1